MNKRGRIAQAAIDAPRINGIKRPEPPAHLEPDAADEWRKVVNRMPADWFPDETHAILEQRCRHVIWMRATADQIDEMTHSKNFDIKEYNFLLRLAASQSRTLINMDTNMRLTQQTTHDKSKRKGAAKAKGAPWAKEKETED
jgi:phage terminase small subunit